MIARKRVVVVLGAVGVAFAGYVVGVATGTYELFPFPLLKQLQDRVAEATAPAPDLERGQKIFRGQCAVCHGPGGKGGYAPSLTDLDRTRDEVTTIIDRGIPGTEMSGIWMPSEERQAVAAYVMSLQEEEAADPVEGDSARGRTVFFGEGACQRCHRIGGKGARLGPDLSGVGDRRSPEALMESLTAPDQRISDGFRWVMVSTPPGRTSEGFLVDRDQFSVLIFDPASGFLSFDKDTVEIEVSPSSRMPSYEDQLTRGQLQDLVAFLSSLRE